jgi:uncharacterized protein YjiS (DUF1127 family)
MPSYDLYLPPTWSSWRLRVRREPIHPFAAAWLPIANWIERSRQRKALSGLTEHELRDIGITRCEAARESDKPFWR